MRAGAGAGAGAGAAGSAAFALRVAAPDDVDAIMALETATFENDAWSRQMMLTDLSQEYCFYLVATETEAVAADPVPVATSTSTSTEAARATDEAGTAAGSRRAAAALSGYAGLMSPRGAGDADIQTIAVAPSARRRGLGRRLMEALIAEARARGARRVFLEVRADNPGAQELYERLGFAPIGVRRGYYQPDDVDAVVMRLDLPGGGAA